MTNWDEMDVDCEEDELSEVQAEFYSNALKEYNLALAEAAKIKKESIVVSKTNSVTVVKSSYQVKLGNATTLVVVPSQAPAGTISLQPLGPSTTAATPTQLNVQKVMQASSQPLAPPKATLSEPHLVAAPPVLKAATLSVAQGPVSKVGTPTVAPSASQGPSLREPQTQTTAQAYPRTPMVTLPIPKQLAASSAGVGSKTPAQMLTALKPAGDQKQVVGSQQAKTVIEKEPHTIDLPAEDPSKMAIRNFPSLMVTVKPSKMLPASSTTTKKREALDAFVKAQLVLTPPQFSEWLMQVGLALSHQPALCSLHRPTPPLQLGKSCEEGKFPFSGGYVWISQCCPQTFISIFKGSIFEEAPHPPSSLLKLIYHWACQTSISNVVQWVKVDRNYVRLFYAMLRSACTVSIQSTTPLFGVGKNGRVEVGVISLGTTSTDGKRRDVKVEVLGIYDQETHKIRLRASEPVMGDTRSRTRFTRILEPLAKWVSPQAIILTDFTVDRATLLEQGFKHVVQKSLGAVSVEDKLNNRNIMEYLRRTVPRVFQNTLSLLTTATVQQFLDELVWREARGHSAADAFHNLIEDLVVQTRAKTSVPLVMRLSQVLADPFQDWRLSSGSYTVGASSGVASSAAYASEPSQTTVAVVETSGKRPAPASTVAEASAPKSARSSCYYGTLPVNKNEPRAASSCEVICQHSECRAIGAQPLSKSNLDVMRHMRMHLSGKDETHQCVYCLSSFGTEALWRTHVKTTHEAIYSIQETAGLDQDSAIVAGHICLICMGRYKDESSLEQHLQTMHVALELPYRCRACNFRTSSHTHLVDHFYEQHGGTSCFLLCPLCLETFTVKGENPSQKGMDTGHLTYLAHLKNHFFLPVTRKNRCKRCLLTFLQGDQLQHHLKIDHVSMVAHPAARPLHVTVGPAPVASSAPSVSNSTNSSTITAPNSVGSSTLTASSTRTVSSPSFVVSTTSKATGAPSVASTAPKNAASKNVAPPVTPKVASSGAKAVATPPTGTNGTAKASTPSTSGKSKSKEAIVAGLNNSMVVRRFTGLAVVADGGELCLECGESLTKDCHFPAYLCCPSCKFATCCVTAMKNHHSGVHGKNPQQRRGPQMGSVFNFSQAVTFADGFRCSNGLDFQKHMTQSKQKYAIVD